MLCEALAVSSSLLEGKTPETLSLQRRGSTPGRAWDYTEPRWGIGSRNGRHESYHPVLLNRFDWDDLECDPLNFESLSSPFAWVISYPAAPARCAPCEY